MSIIKKILTTIAITLLTVLATCGLIALVILVFGDNPVVDVLSFVIGSFIGLVVVGLISVVWLEN